MATSSGSPRPTSLSTAAARNLVTVTKTRPQMQGITPRWVLAMLPWVETSGGVFRVNRHRAAQMGGRDIEIAAGHRGEPELPTTFADYEPEPREYELSVAQTILRVHTRVSDLFGPMDQVQEQLRLTIHSLRETQEHEMLNNPEFGLLHNVHPKQRIHTRQGSPTPDDLDTLITRRRKTRLLFAHPLAIAAFGRECNARGIHPGTRELAGHVVRTWRGIPLLPCDKLPVSDDGTTSIVAIRPGLKDQGVVALHQTGIPDEVEPSLNVRFMQIDERAVASYLVSAYYSVAALLPDSFGVLDDVQIGRHPH